MNAEAQDSRPVESRSQFVQALRELLVGLPTSAPRELAMVDVDFAQWPLGESAVIDALTRWAQLPGRRLRIVGMRFDHVGRQAPRFAAWRRHWAHLIQCMSPVELDETDLPCLLLASGQLLQLHDREHGRGIWSTEAQRLRQARELVDLIWQRSEPAWPPDMLGL